MPFKVNQLKKDGSIVRDFDSKLSQAELREKFISLISIKPETETTNLLQINGLSVILKNIVYSGNPSSIDKKRIQVDSKSLALLQKKKTVIIGLYSYENCIIFVVFNPKRFLNRFTKSYTSAHIDIHQLKLALLYGTYKNDREDLFATSSKELLSIFQQMSKTNNMVKEIEHSESVSVSTIPNLNILKTYVSYPYKHWYALAEFVDNSIDSYLKNKDQLKALYPDEKYKLIIEVDIDPETNSINIKDNAAGIDENNFSRAFELAHRPDDDTMLSEFGMGMKTAAIWYTDTWSLSTTSISDGKRRVLNFDVEEIITNNKKKLTAEISQSDKLNHGTVINLTNIRELPKNGQTLKKIKDFLSQIYIKFSHEPIDIKFNKEVVEYHRPKNLFAPFWKSSDKYPPEKRIDWEVEIDTKFTTETKTIKVTGFIGILGKIKKGSNHIKLFRRNRLIINNYQPSEIFGSEGSHQWKRIYGELNIEGVKVSNSKNELLWGDDEPIFLDKIVSIINSSNSLPILSQALNYRIDDDPFLQKAIIDQEVEKLRDSYNDNDYINKMNQILGEKIPKTYEDNEKKELLDEVFSLDNTKTDLDDDPLLIKVKQGGATWEVFIKFEELDTYDDLFEVSNNHLPEDIRDELYNAHKIGVLINLNNRYYRSVRDNRKNLIILIKNIAIAEAIVIQQRLPIKFIKKYINKLLTIEPTK